MLLPLLEPNKFGAVDGVYFAVITFSTVGLGDYTIDFSGDTSLNQNFTYSVFVLFSIEVGLLAAVCSSAFDYLSEMRWLLGRSKGLGRSVSRAAGGVLAAAKGKRAATGQGAGGTVTASDVVVTTSTSAAVDMESASVPP